MSLSKTLYPLPSTGLILEDPSRHDCFFLFFYLFYTDGLLKRNTWITALIYDSKKKAEQ